MKTSTKIAVIGLGYVGLPLARLFATKYPVVGFDINQSRIDGLRSSTDSTLEVSDANLQKVLIDNFDNNKNDAFVKSSDSKIYTCVDKWFSVFK